MNSFSFPKTERLLNRTEFVNVNRSGKRFHTRHFVVILKENGLGITRLGVTASRKVGNAVKRNRTKRLIRECFRLNRAQLPQGYDIVIAAKKDASYLDLSKTTEELKDVLFDQKFRI